MLKYLIFFLVPLIQIQADMTPYLTSEVNTLAIVENLVNVETGKFLQIDSDLPTKNSHAPSLVRYKRMYE